MRFVLDMVHHNPGEAPFETSFLDPAFLKAIGYNGIVFKHLNCVATFERIAPGLFAPGTPEGDWMTDFTARRAAEISGAKAAGLAVFCHIDLFVLPRSLVERLGGDLIGEDGRIGLDRPRAREVHRAMFEELTERFPEVDGYIVRVGETYLFDTPHHVGNGPFRFDAAGWDPEYGYAEALRGEPAPTAWNESHAAGYAELISFLRGEICARQDRFLIFRTWDIFPDRLHAMPENYLDVTDRIEPHEKLIFSLKHTALDFWRRVRPNDAIGIGRHPQIVEVQSQREYEGKGAFPNYVMHGVAEGFEENAAPRGLAEMLAHPLVRGVFGWSRGGGWYGPYLKSEFWPELNARVLAGVASGKGSEAEVFARVAREWLGLSGRHLEMFRNLCLLSARGILLGRHCAAFDEALGEKLLPTACWMRDDRLGGRYQLRRIFEFLIDRRLVGEALREKSEAAELWRMIAEIAAEIEWPRAVDGEVVRASAEYGRLLFAMIEQGWRVMAFGATGEIDGVAAAAAAYRELRAQYLAHCRESPHAATPFDENYFSLPGAPGVPGLGETIEFYLNQGDKL